MALSVSSSAGSSTKRARTATVFSRPRDGNPFQVNEVFDSLLKPLIVEFETELLKKVKVFADAFVEYKVAEYCLTQFAIFPHDAFLPSPLRMKLPIKVYRDEPSNASLLMAAATYRSALVKIHHDHCLARVTAAKTATNVAALMEKWPEQLHFIALVNTEDGQPVSDTEVEAMSQYLRGKCLRIQQDLMAKHTASALVLKEHRVAQLVKDTSATWKDIVGDSPTFDPTLHLSHLLKRTPGPSRSAPAPVRPASKRNTLPPKPGGKGVQKKGSRPDSKPAPKPSPKAGGSRV